MRFGLFFWIFLAVECSRWTTGQETPIEIFETINNGHMNPDSLEIFTTKKNVIIEENTKVTTEDLIETTQNADSMNNSTQENSTDISSTNSYLFSDPESTKLEEATYKTPKNLIVNGLDLIASDEMFNQISASENQETITEINIKESINGRTSQRKPTQEELKYIQNHSNEIIEDLDELLKSDTGSVEDDLFEDDEVDTMFKRAGDFRNFFHSERRNFSDTNEFNIVINETEGDSFDDDSTTNKFDFIEKLMNKNKEETFTTPDTTIQKTTILSKTENDTIESETEAQPVETSTHPAIEMEMLNLNVENTENDTVESVKNGTEPVKIMTESSTADVIADSKTSTENYRVESVTVATDVEIFTVDSDNYDEVLTATILPKTEAAAILSESTTAVQNSKISSENGRVESVTVATNVETFTVDSDSYDEATISPNNEASTESAQSVTILSESTAVQNTERNTVNSVDATFEISTESIENATSNTQNENDTGKSVIEAALSKTETSSKIEDSTQPIEAPIDSATTKHDENAKTSIQNNTAVTATINAVSIETLTENYTVESVTPNIDTASSETLSEFADKEILNVDAQTTEHYTVESVTATQSTEIEVTTEPVRPIEILTESATVVANENTETSFENYAQNTENYTESAQPTESPMNADAQINAETSTENNKPVTFLTKIEATTEPQYVEASTEMDKTDTITSTSTVNFPHIADGEVLAENGVSIQDFNDITNLVATSLDEIKVIVDNKATLETIIEESTATIPEDTSTVKIINIETSTTPFITEEDIATEKVLPETTTTMSTTSAIPTTEAESVNIEEAFQQTKTTNLPRMEPTTTDQSINDVISTTIIQESYSYTNEIKDAATEMSTESVNLNSKETTTKHNEATIFVEEVFTTSTEQSATHKIVKEFFQEPSPSDVESMFNAKLEEQESMEDDSSWTIFGKPTEEHFETPDFLADGKTVQMVPMLRTKILQNAAEFSVKISKKGDNFYIPVFAFIKEYDNIVNITWNTNEGGNNSLALKVSNNEKFYIIKEVVMNVFRGNKFNMQKKAVALTPDPDMDDTMPGRTRTVAMRDGTFITFSNVEFLKKSEIAEISEAATESQGMWHFEVASVSIAVITIIAVLIYYIAVKTRTKVVLRGKDELHQVTHC